MDGGAVSRSSTLLPFCCFSTYLPIPTDESWGTFILLVSRTIPPVFVVSYQNYFDTQQWDSKTKVFLPLLSFFLLGHFPAVPALF